MIVWLLLSRVSAQDTTKKPNTITASPKIDMSIADELNKTSMRYCIDWFTPDKLSRMGSLTLQPGKSKDICVVFINNIPKDKEFTIGFSEWTLDGAGLISCDQNMDNNKFLNMMMMPEKTIKIMVASGSTTVTSFKIKIPTTATGNIYGCLAYSLPNSYSKGSGEIFWIFARKVAPIEIIVTWDVYTLGRRDDLKDAYTLNKNRILQSIIAILAIWIIVSIAKVTKKKEEKHHHKK